MVADEEFYKYYGIHISITAYQLNDSSLFPKRNENLKILPFFKLVENKVKFSKTIFYLAITFLCFFNSNRNSR